MDQISKSSSIRKFSVISTFLILVKLNKNRSVTGILRGYDQFMNLTLDQAKDKETSLGLIVIRGNSVELIEALEFIPEK